MAKRNVINMAIACRRCRCVAMYSGTLDVKRTAECAECRHPLVDHTVSMKGATEAELQFSIAREGDGG